MHDSTAPSTTAAEARCMAASARDAQPLVSIIVPAYQARPYLGEALDDVASQSYRNWELVVVEDGSPDSVAEVVEAFRARCSQAVRYHRQPHNQGPSVARNVAIELAQGDMFAFLDADDRWLPDHLERKVTMLEAQAADVAYGTVELFDDETGDALSTWGPSPEDLASFPLSLFTRCFIQPSGVVVQRGVVERVGPFDSSLSFAEDLDFWIRAVRAGQRFAYDPKITSRYRKNHDAAATTGRLVLTCDGVARVVFKHADLIEDPYVRRQFVTRHLVTAGLGHLAYRPTARNRLDPAVGRALLSQAVAVDPLASGARRWAGLATTAAQAGASPLLRWVFRKGYRRLNRRPFNLSRRLASRTA